MVCYNITNVNKSKLHFTANALKTKNMIDE